MFCYANYLFFWDFQINNKNLQLAIRSRKHLTAIENSGLAIGSDENKTLTAFPIL